MPKKRDILVQGFAWFIATTCGIGHAPIASGTVASLAAIGLWYVLHPSLGMQWMACLFTVLIGTWAADVVAKRVKDEDPSVVVIDEWVGMWLSVIGLPRTIPIVCAGFLLFRFFDIGKFPPMKQLERLPGGAGIMLDDVAAGLITRGVLAIVLTLFSK